VFTRNKEDKTEYVERDVLDNFSTFPRNSDVGPVLVVTAANQSTSRATKTIRNKDSAVKAICIAKSRSRSKEIEAASASRKLDTSPRLEVDIQDAGSTGGPNSNLVKLQQT
jgi:hypothetical protein